LKRFAVIAAFVFLVAPQAFAGGTWLKSMAAAQKEAKAKNQLIFVDLFAEWCGWCHRFEKEVFPSQVFQAASKDMVLLRLDTEDRGEGTKYAQQYQITSLPTFLVLTSDLTIAGIIRGYAPPNEFARILTDTKTKYEAFRKKVAAEPSMARDYQGRLDIAREFTARQGYTQSEQRLKKLVTEKAVPQDVRDRAYFELALAQTLQKKYDAALKTINTLSTLQKAGEPLERSRFLVGQIYMEQGNLAGATNEFRTFKAKFPKSPLVRDVDQVLPRIEQQLGTRR
jgi:thioredoxin-related protein